MVMSRKVFNWFVSAEAAPRLKAANMHPLHCTHKGTLLDVRYILCLSTQQSSFFSKIQASRGLATCERLTVTRRSETETLISDSNLCVSVVFTEALPLCEMKEPTFFNPVVSGHVSSCLVREKIALKFFLSLAKCAQRADKTVMKLNS